MFSENGFNIENTDLFLSGWGFNITEYIFIDDETFFINGSYPDNLQQVIFLP